MLMINTGRDCCQCNFLLRRLVLMRTVKGLFDNGHCISSCNIVRLYRVNARRSLVSQTDKALILSL